MPVNSNGVVCALMHPAGEGVPHAASVGWTIEPLVPVLIALAMAAYALGVRRLWTAGGRGAGVRAWQAACFAGGCAAIVAALMSPLDAMSGVLSSAHMVQHELLIVVAAPLVVAGLPGMAFLFALPRRAREPLIRFCRYRTVSAIWFVLTAPALVWLLHAVALWIWHVPALYEAALRSTVVHALEHASFFLTAMLFWWGIARGRYGQQQYGAAAVYVFATALQSGLLGAALTIAPSAWYPSYAATTVAWGLTPLEDQQLAGLIMWVPAGVVFTAAGLVFFALWLRESERRSRVIRAASVVCLAVCASMSWACSPDVSAEAAAITGGDPERGREAIHTYGCDSCHVVPGVRSARGRVGPPLGGIASRVYIAGHLPNTPSNMEDWIQRPHSSDRQTVMPETGVSPEAARDLAAYLYTLR